MAAPGGSFSGPFGSGLGISGAGGSGLDKAAAAPGSRGRAGRRAARPAPGQGRSVRGRRAAAERARPAPGPPAPAWRLRRACGRPLVDGGRTRTVPAQAERETPLHGAEVCSARPAGSAVELRDPHRHRWRPRCRRPDRRQAGPVPDRGARRWSRRSCARCRRILADDSERRLSRAAGAPPARDARPRRPSLPPASRTLERRTRRSPRPSTTPASGSPASWSPSARRRSTCCAAAAATEKLLKNAEGRGGQRGAGDRHLRRDRAARDDRRGRSARRDWPQTIAPTRSGCSPPLRERLPRLTAAVVEAEVEDAPAPAPPRRAPARRSAGRASAGRSRTGRSSGRRRRAARSRAASSTGRDQAASSRTARREPVGAGAK